MPRRPRIQIDGLPLHIVQRGHNRGACFFADQDRLAYLGWLREALEREHPIVMPGERLGAADGPWIS